MSHRPAKHEKAYRKGKLALKASAASKEAAGRAASEFRERLFKTVKEAAKKYGVDDMAVHRRLKCALLSCKLPKCEPPLSLP